MLEAGLPAARINWNMARDVVHGLTALQRLGIPNLFNQQFQARVSKMLRFGHLINDMTGQLIHSSIQALIVETGLPGNVFDHDPQPLPGVATDCRAFQVWHELWEHHLQLTTDLHRTPTTMTKC